jgi:ubiquinone/menaquinone biosynthesis C-methylase UbiE
MVEQNLTTISREYYEEVVNRDRQTDVLYAANRIIRKISKLRTPKEGETILDIGCGTGVVTAAFSKLGFKAIGVDVVPEFIHVAQKDNPAIRYFVGAAEDLPFPDEEFDYITLSSLLEHVQDWRKTLREAARVLRPNGVLVLNTTGRFCPVQNEIRYIYGFGYLPSFIQRSIYSLVMKYRPQMVGHTHLPAYHWFYYGQLAREIEKLNMYSFNWLELMTEEDFPPGYEKYARLIMFLIHLPVPLHYFLFPGTVIVAQKRFR